MSVAVQNAAAHLGQELGESGVGSKARPHDERVDEEAYQAFSLQMIAVGYACADRNVGLIGVSRQQQL